MLCAMSPLGTCDWGRNSPTPSSMTCSSPRQSPSLLTGSLRLVTLLSVATMRPLRLPLPLPRSLRFPSLPESLVAFRISLAWAAESMTHAPGRCEPGVVRFRLFEGSVRLSQLSRIPPDVFAPLSDPGPAPLRLACASRRKRLTVRSAVLSPLAQTGRPRR
jgi:hypothetical protein